MAILLPKVIVTSVHVRRKKDLSNDPHNNSGAKMAYSTYDDVLRVCGLSLTRIVNLHEGDMTTAQVTTMIQDFIAEADQQIKDLLPVPIIIRDELHVADGENSAFDLGSSDQEHYSDYDVENCLESIVHCYHEKACEDYRYGHPYPVDCDKFITEDDAIWTETSNCTVANETAIKRVGTYSIKMTFSAAGYTRCVLGGQLLSYAPEQHVDQFDYVAFLFRTDDATVTFTLHLYDVNGNSDTQTFTVAHDDQWYIVWIKIDEMTGTIEWEDEVVHKIAISSDGACVAYLEMFNFNDGYCWEAPLGKLYIHEAENAGEEAPSAGDKFYATYKFDPYTVTIPVNIKKASKCMAGQALVEHLIGLRQSITAFEAQGESGERIPDREALFNTRNMLKKMAEEALEGIGFGFDFDPVRG